MPKANRTPSLNLGSARPSADVQRPLSPSTLSPGSPRSVRSVPGSVPGSPYLQDYSPFANMEQGTEGSRHGSSDSKENIDVSMINASTSPTISAIPEYPPSPPKSAPKHGREPSKSFFSNLMASKSSHRLGSPDRTEDESADKPNGRSRASSKDRQLYSSRGRGSTPDLLKNAGVPEEPEQHSSGEGNDTATQLTGENGHVQSSVNKKSRARFGVILNRSTSRAKPTPPNRLNLETPPSQGDNRDPQFAEGMRTAPLRADHREGAFREMQASITRNRSADRQPTSRQGNLAVPSKKERMGSTSSPHSGRDGGGTNLLSNLQQTGKGVGDRLGKAGKGFLGKITRSGSTTERELVTDDNYTCTVITLPLIQQTRSTRIARKLELSKDKTEFWMPALPWRCIDYLNMCGCEEEGLYRIPGSGRDVKHWQRRFDTEHDINLFDEPELYDINTIGSMFKAWLRDLPDEIFPKLAQMSIAEQCMGASTTPQLLKDELSKLPPFNYYLLFAITCHLSLLHSFADKNKMDYRNLCICFQPCLKIEGFVFQFLVQDWKNCWQGCWTEKEFLEEEYQYENDVLSAQATSNDRHSVDERAVSSSDSGQYPAPQASMTQPIPRIQRSVSPLSNSRQNRNGSANEIGIVYGDQNEPTQRSDTHLRANSHLPELGPLKPIRLSG